MSTLELVECCKPLAAATCWPTARPTRPRRCSRRSPIPRACGSSTGSPRATSRCARASSCPCSGLSQPTVSHHLSKLARVGLLEREQRGKWAYFSLNPEIAEQLAGDRSTPGGRIMSTDTADTLREQVASPLRRGRARRPDRRPGSCGSGSCCDGAELERDFGEALYSPEQRGELPTQPRSRRSAAATRPPSPISREGEVVLDLGSGGGIDVILSAKPCRPDRCRLRPRHDRRDARARAEQRARGRRLERALPQGRDRADPASGRARSTS